MFNKTGYIPPKPSFKADFDKMCNELNYKPDRQNLKEKKGCDNDVVNQERIIYRSRGKGAL